MSHETIIDLLDKNLSTREQTTPRIYSGVAGVNSRREDGITKGPQQMLIYQQDSGQIWAIVGCLLTIGNIIAALVIYLYKRRKRKLRQRAHARAAGSVPSESHYTLPINPDPHYLQIMDGPEGTSARKRNDVDDGGYITVIERDSRKNSGYTDIVHLSNSLSHSQRSNSYQEIAEVSDFSLSSHLPVQATRSLDPPMRIHKRRDKYLVNINIPRDSALLEEEEVRKSCVLSPELMDEELFESLTNFSKYFTSLSVKKRKENSNCEEDEISLATYDVIDEGNDVKETEFIENKMKDTEDKSSSEDQHIQDKDTIRNDDINNESSARPRNSLQNEVKQQCDGNIPLCKEVELEGQSSSIVKEHQELPMEVSMEHRVEARINEKGRVHRAVDLYQSSISSKEDLCKQKVSKMSRPNTECLENSTTLKETKKIDNKDNNQACACLPANEEVQCIETGEIKMPLKKRGLLLAPLASFNSDHSLNKYIRKNGILLPVKTAADDSSATDNSYKRDTL